jgi:hypothetical protein
MLSETYRVDIRSKLVVRVVDALQLHTGKTAQDRYDRSGKSGMGKGGEEYDLSVYALLRLLATSLSPLLDYVNGMTGLDKQKVLQDAFRCARGEELLLNTANEESDSESEGESEAESQDEDKDGSADDADGDGESGDESSEQVRAAKKARRGSPQERTVSTKPVIQGTTSTNPVIQGTTSANPVTQGTTSANPVTQGTTSTDPVIPTKWKDFLWGPQGTPWLRASRETKIQQWLRGKVEGRTVKIYAAGEGEPRTTFELEGDTPEELEKSLHNKAWEEGHTVMGDADSSFWEGVSWPAFEVAGRSRSGRTRGT